MEYDYEEDGIIFDLVLIGTAVIVVGMVIMVGLNVMANTSAQTTTAITALDANSEAYANSAIQGSFQLVSIVPTNSVTVVVAVFGGIAIGAIIAYMLAPLLRSFGGGIGGATVSM